MPPKTKNLKQTLATSQGNTSEPVETSKKAGKRPITRSEKQKKKSSTKKTSTRHDQETTGEDDTAYTDQEKKDIQCLQDISFHPTRYIRVTDLKAMGIYDDVLKILDKMGLGRFAQHRHELYPDLAREFFGTVELTYTHDRYLYPDEDCLTFKISGKAYRVTITDICKVYGFPNGMNKTFGTFTNLREFWSLIACGREKGGPKMNMIRHPALRIIAKFLANTFFARKESSSIKQTEIRMLFKGVRERLLNVEKLLLLDTIESTKVNLGCLFAKELIGIRSWARTTKDPHCYMGGLLPPLLEYAGVRLADHYKDRYADFIDRRYMINCHFIENVPNVYRFIIYNHHKERFSVDLPCPEKTNIFKGNNIRFLYFDTSSTASSSTQPQDPPEPTLNEETWTFPEFQFQPSTPREKLLCDTIKKQQKFQQKINKMFTRKFNWMKTKLRNIAGYESDEEEYMRREEEKDKQVATADDENTMDDEDVTRYNDDPYDSD